MTTTIPVGRSPSALAVGDGSIWVADSGDGTITRIDPGTDQATATIRVGGSPQAIAIGGGRVWVSVDAAATTPTLAASAGTLRMETLADLDSLDPALAYSAGSWQLLYATCAKLLNYPDRSGSAGSELTPEVAAGLPALSADRRTYTFTIRPGFRFSPPSDQAVTAQTFEATIERTLNPRMKSPIAYEFGNVVGAVPYMGGKADRISGVRARGDKLIIRLLRPEPDIPSRLAQPFFCAVPTDTPIDPAGLRVIPSAGPYYVTSYSPDQTVVLAGNPNYRGSRPHRVQRIVLALGVSSQRAVGDIEAGRADYTSIGGTPASTVSALAAHLAAQYGPASPAAAHHRQEYFAESQHPELDFLILNTHRPLFSDLRLRQAVNYAIDRQALARLGDGYGSADRPATQYLPPGIPGFTPSAVYPVTPDLAKARALASGQGRTAVLYSCDYAACRQQAQIVSDDLAAIGLHVEVKIFDHATLYARLATPTEPFDIAFGTWLTDYPDPADAHRDARGSRPVPHIRRSEVRSASSQRQASSPAHSDIWRSAGSRSASPATLRPSSPTATSRQRGGVLLPTHRLSDVLLLCRSRPGRALHQTRRLGSALVRGSCGTSMHDSIGSRMPRIRIVLAGDHARPPQYSATGRVATSSLAAACRTNAG